MGNKLSSSSPFGSYKAKDGYVVICTITDGQWINVLKAIGREDLQEDNRFRTRVLRVQNMKAVEEILDNWLREKTVADAVEQLRKFKVPTSEVPTFSQVANDPQIKHREMIVEIEQPLSGKVKLSGSVYKMSKTPGDRKMRIPEIGEYNKYVYSKLLGLSEEEIERLEEKDII